MFIKDVFATIKGQFYKSLAEVEEVEENIKSSKDYINSSRNQIKQEIKDRQEKQGRFDIHFENKR